MGPEGSPACADVHKKTNMFLSDMLSEVEYELFVEHLAGCDRCKSYVRSIGSLSNQLWRLGDVEVPSDPAPTVVFDVKSEEAKRTLERRKIFLVSVMIVGVAAAIAASLFFVSASYIKHRRAAEKAAPLSGEQPGAPAAPGTDTVKFEAVTVVREPAGTVSGPGEPQQETAKTEAGSPPPAAMSAAEHAERRHSLHRHFIYYDGSERRKFTEALRLAGLLPDFRTQDLCFFKAADKVMGDISEKAFLCSRYADPFPDFSAVQHPSPDEKHVVSLYFEKIDDRSSAELHWHLILSSPEQKDRFFEMIAQEGGAVEYNSADIVIISLPDSKIDTLKRRFTATGAGFSEFGAFVKRGGVLSSASMKISVYFETTREGGY